MSEIETIEVPVTRTVRVALVGRVDQLQRYTPDMFRLDGIPDPTTVLGKLCRFVVRPCNRPGYPWRSGIGVVHAIQGNWIECDVSGIPALAEGDYVYLVEDS